MQELLKNSWSGWLRYTDNGKFAALLLVILLFLWFRREHRNKEILIYTTVVAIFCICPISAALLRKYQTQFYDYEWIWNYVPVTIMLAYGITVFLASRWESYQKEVRQKGNTVTRKHFWETVIVTIGTVAVVLLCGRLGNPIFQADEERKERQQAQLVLEALAEQSELASDAQTERAEQLVLWAPREIMAYARIHDGSIRLVYGRNMWDKALLGYAYESYGDVEESMYRWMTSVEENGNQSRQEFLAGGLPCVEAALERGVNCILLPEDTAQENVEALESAFNWKVRTLEGYYIFIPND